jgi:uncharacterized protein YggE
VTQAPAAAAALKDNTEAMQRLFKRLATLGIAEKDVQTATFTVAPQHKRGSQGQYEPGIVGYEVTNQLRVKVRDLPRLGQVLDQVVAEGANVVHGINFTVADPQPMLDLARTRAMADARRKAELYAKAAGVEAGRVLLIQEPGLRVPAPPSFGLTRAAAPVPVAPGELEFHESVAVTYAIGK